MLKGTPPAEDKQTEGIIDSIEAPDIRALAALVGLQGDATRRTLKEAAVVVTLVNFFLVILLIAVFERFLQ